MHREGGKTAVLCTQWALDHHSSVTGAYTAHLSGFESLLERVEVGFRANESLITKESRVLKLQASSLRSQHSRASASRHRHVAYCL